MLQKTKQHRQSLQISAIDNALVTRRVHFEHFVAQGGGADGAFGGKLQLELARRENFFGFFDVKVLLGHFIPLLLKHRKYLVELVFQVVQFFL